MGFVGKSRCYSFTPVSVRQNAPPLSGVYGVSNARQWLLIGGADDVQAALRRHLAEAGTALANAGPTGFTYELCDQSSRGERLARLIADLAPSCNNSSAP